MPANLRQLADAIACVGGTQGRIELCARNQANDDDLREWCRCLAGDLQRALNFLDEVQAEIARRDRNGGSNAN